MHTAYDRYRNPLETGCRVMQNGSRLWVPLPPFMQIS